MAIPGRGSQVVLEGYARTVARGAASRSMRGNLTAMEALVIAGLAADGSTPDGSSRTGAQPYDLVVAQFPHEPLSAWELPAPLLGVGVNHLLYQTTVPAGNGADTTVDLLQTYTLPAGLLRSVGDRVTVRAGGGYIGSTDSKSLTLVWSGTPALLTMVANTATGVFWALEAVIMKTGTNAQSYTSRANTNNNTSQAGQGVRTATDAVPIVINLNGQNTTNPTANAVTCSYFTVDYMAAAS